MAHEMTAYFIDRMVSFTKQCFGITSMTSRLVGKVFGSRASPFNPLSCTPSMSIATAGEGSTATAGGMATAMLKDLGRKPPLALVRGAAARGAEKREKDEWVVNAVVVVPQEHRATAEAVAAAVAFILLIYVDAEASLRVWAGKKRSRVSLRCARVWLES